MAPDAMAPPARHGKTLIHVTGSRISIWALILPINPIGVAVVVVAVAGMCVRDNSGVG